MISNRLTP